jgi:hypothetical protein
MYVVAQKDANVCPKIRERWRRRTVNATARRSPVAGVDTRRTLTKTGRPTDDV